MSETANPRRPSGFDPAPLGRRAAEMIEALAAVSAENGRLIRLYLSPQHRQAADLVARWMGDAGLEVFEDALGTVRGRLAGDPGRNDRPVLYVGSHIDTVIDAGRYDGTLGVIAAILAVKELKARDTRLPFDIEVLAFGDEEGSRFPTALTSSAAIAGILPDRVLDVTDRHGISLADALRAFGKDPGLIPEAAADPSRALGYLEVHIEQGPVLEAEGLPLGIVSSIAGCGRYTVSISGVAGHAGTVPMRLRRDALAGAAELMTAIERIARAGETDAVVATVGQLSVAPGAVNVIPASVNMSLDVRAAVGAAREAAFAAIREEAKAIAGRRSLSIEFDTHYETPVVPCAARLRAAAQEAVASLGLAVRELASGAGHDGIAMHRLTDIGMLFVRCRGGVSHNPAEFVTVEDMGYAVEALTRWIETLAEDGEKA